MSRQQLDRLRQRMAACGADACLIVSDDYHGSEYVGEFFRARAYLTGFTGSAGTAVVTADDARLWTDGRYFLQAEQQLKDSGFSLMKTGEEGVPTPIEFLTSVLQDGQTLAFDGQTVCAALAEELRLHLRRRGVRVMTDRDLVGEIWEDRPPFPAAPAWLLDTEYAGQSREDKLRAVRQRMDEREVDSLLVTSLDDVMWLLNIRGADVAYTPVLLSYLYLDCGQCWLFCRADAFSELDRIRLETSGVTLAPYEQMAEILPQLTDLTVWLDPKKTNYALTSRLPASAKRLEEPLPTTLLKAVKNETEQANMRAAHVEDGVAVTRFLYWLKTEGVGQTERAAAEKLESYRRAVKDYRGPSFEPIVAAGDHGAIVHYAATEESDRVIGTDTLVLCDTGGHYLRGTTDVTRTVSIGNITEETKEDYTAVLRGHLRLAAAIFKDGTRGRELDILARGPVWAHGADYRHGTGHGVGYLLSVHEGPNGFSARDESGTLKAGMITSDEPGIYREGAYGVRIENLLLCCQAAGRSAGFLGFESLTLVPYDRAAILPARLTAEEMAWLNAYHQKVYETLSPHLTAAEAAWLSSETAPFGAEEAV